MVKVLHGSDGETAAKWLRLHARHVQPDKGWISARSTTWLRVPWLLRRLSQLGV